MSKALENPATISSGIRRKKLETKPLEIMPLPLTNGAHFTDAALVAYGQVFEHPCKIRLVRWLARALAGGRIKMRHVGGAIIAIDPEDYIGGPFSGPAARSRQA